MSDSIHVTFSGMSRSDAAVDSIERHAAKLETLGGAVRDCHVRVERHGHKAQGNPFEIRVFLGLANRGGEVKKLEASGSHVDVYVAIQDAFLAMEKQISHATHPPRHRPGHHGDLVALVSE